MNEAFSKLKTWGIQHYWLLLILVVGSFLRLYKLDFQSFWADELYSTVLSTNISFFDVLGNFKRTAHPPFYFIVLSLYSKIFGASSFAIKLLSAFIGVLGVFSIYKLGKALMNKKIGLLAAALLSINYFHIYYSQEARMYGLLFLLAVLSFYFLVKLVKQPNTIYGVLYGISVAMLINTHFYGISVLVSQVFILLYFTWQPHLISRMKFIKYCSISGVIAILSYIPVLNTIKGHTKTKSLWIPKINSNTLNYIFESFFGKSEVLIVIVIVLFTLFIVKLSQIKKLPSFALNPVKDSWAFSYVLIFTWIFISIFVPVFYSYTKVSIIIDRYLIHLLAPLLLICAIGLYQIKNHILRSGFILAILVFSLINLFFEKEYYSKVHKSQLREICDHVRKHKKEDTILVSSIAFFLDYYFPEEKLKESDLSNHLKEIKQGKSTPENFWYLDGDVHKFSVNKEDNQILTEHFILKDSIHLYKAWARYYIVKE